MRQLGFTDRDIWDIAAVAAFFNMSNQLAAATDMRPNAEYYGMARTEEDRLVQSVVSPAMKERTPHGNGVASAICSRIAIGAGAP